MNKKAVRRFGGLVALIAYAMPWIDIPFIRDYVDFVTGFAFIRFALDGGFKFLDGLGGLATFNQNLLILGYVALFALIGAILALLWPSLTSTIIFLLPATIFLVSIYSQEAATSLVYIGIKMLIVAVIIFIASFFIKEKTEQKSKEPEGQSPQEGRG